MSMAFDIFQLAEQLSAVGLNHFGVVQAAAYDAGLPPHLQTAALAPETRSIVVFASAGPALWNALLSDLRGKPSHFTESNHPLDDFVERSVIGTDGIFGELKKQWFLASETEDVQLDFRRLAVLAGLGVQSRLGIVIHPVFGPWMGIRAACFLPVLLEPTALVEDLCGDCAAPCIDACPGEAFVEGMWEVGRCADFHRTSSRCAFDCDSRLACPIGTSFRYPTEERRYHSHRESGRIVMAQLLDIEDDYRSGVGPDWG